MARGLMKIIYLLGREFRFIRILYHKLSGGKYLWGLYQGMVDTNSKRDYD